MKYMLLIHNSFGDRPAYNEEAMAAEMAQHAAFAGLVAPRGSFSGEALEAPETGRTIRKGADGEFVVTDGPFADVKEQIGGYYVIEADNLDEAVELAKHCPNYEGIEVRPVWDIPGM